MKLRLKVLLILASMWAIISLVIFVYSKSTFTQEYARLEVKEVTDDLERVNKTLVSLFISLKLLDFDWSQWDDAYHFMKDKNEKFIKTNMAFTTFENSKLNFIYFFNPAGKLFYGLTYDLNRKQFVPMSQDLWSHLQNESAYTRETDPKGKVGILRDKDSYVVLSALPILTSEGKGPSAGTLMMGYYLTEDHIKELSDIVKMKVQLFPLPLPRNNPELNAVYDNLIHGEQDHIAVKNKSIILGYTLIRDIDKHPIGILGIEVPRILYTEGIKTIDSYLAIVISIGIVFLISIWFLLKAFVMDRIINVSQQVIEITNGSKFSNRIHTEGQDEIEDMATAINSLMEIIELTEEQLKYRIFLRTEELERLSKLNKNLYTEMGNQKIVEGKLREGEKVLRNMAYYDSLTGLPNRVFLHEILQKMIMHAERHEIGLAVIFLDADKFKSINDTYGHDIGDKFLRHIAERLKSSIKESDVAARLAGDEFIICINNVRGKDAITLAIRKILENTSIPLISNHIEISSTFSVGIATYPDDGKSVEELEKHADLAMYYAKKQDGTSFCFYEEITKGVPSIAN